MFIQEPFSPWEFPHEDQSTRVAEERRSGLRGDAFGGLPLEQVVLCAGNSSASAKPETAGIQHIVAVTMENRSFDHFPAWLPNADGQQAGLAFVDNDGVARPLLPIWEPAIDA